MKYAPLLLAGLVFAVLPAHAVELQRNTGQQDISPSSIPESATEFARVIDDLPLMPGLRLVDEDDVLFQSPTGRIAETTAEGEVDIDDVYNFYRRSLPQLGWKAGDIHTYRRNSEILHIDARAEGKTTIVQFAVTPVSGK